MSKKKFNHYTPVINLKNEVLNAMHTKPHVQLNYKQIAKIIGITDKASKNQILKVLGELAVEKKITQTQQGKFKLVIKTSTVQGIVDMTRSGAAYIKINELDSDVYVSARNLGTALHGDKVKLSVFARKKGKIEGEILEILERAKTEFVGVVEVPGKFAFLLPDSPKMHVDIFIPLGKLNGAKHGDKAIAKLTDWPKDASSPFGEITTVLGRPGEHEVEINSILSEYGFPLKFPEHVEQEAAKLPIEITQAEIAKRKDFRDTLTITIDPIDAKDFDDALSFKILENGNIEIGVHIADVTHYVKPGGNIDKEAISRATSIYLVDRVIPMLPEVLSNNVCSLRPHEDKLCFAAVFEINQAAQIQNTWIGRTVIHSNRRFHYDEVQQILEAGSGELFEELNTMNNLAKIFRNKRLSSGAIAFDKVEVRFQLDDNKQPVGVFLKVQKDAHKLIEEFMLLANKAVAERIGKPTKNSQPKTFVYRIHDTPDEEKLKDFATFVKKFGYDFQLAKTSDIAGNLNKLIEELKGKREENMIENLAIRTMAKAEYSTQNIGHYGLGFTYYTHFTSPIRRYPDVMVHRLLQKYLSGGNSEDLAQYEQWCKHSSEMERKAAEAERDSTKYYQVLYMQNAVGKEFKGFVTGVTEFGLFIEIEETKCEGMVRLRDINNDFYYFDEKNYRIIGHNTEQIIQLGDEVKIKVKKADLVRRQLDFALVFNN